MTLPAELPGAGLPLTQEDPKSFPHGLLLFCPSIVTVRELNMLKAMNTTTDKPDWTTKINDPAIVEKWRAEVKSQLDFTDKMFDWCIAELKDKAKQFLEEGFVIALDGDVCKSDSLISESTRLEIVEAIKVLEDVPEKQKDWHPGSDDLVLDLVHPSLFPLVYGRSRILEDRTISLEDCLDNIGKGVVLKEIADTVTVSKTKGNIHIPHAWSRKFQWLPADISFHEVDGKKAVKFDSYINNLHPRHKDIYRLVEEVITKSIPMWNRTLLGTKTINNTTNRLPWVIEYDFDEDEVPEEVYEGLDEEDEDGRWDVADEWRKDMRETHAVLPEAPDYKPWKDRAPRIDKTLQVDLWEQYKERGLQVIVKFASIHLTPDKPKYEGGSWHFEGQLNDHICATSIYYYSNENITPSSLKFRQEVDVEETIDWGYGQNEHEFMQPLFGKYNEEPGIQNIGAVDTKQGRLITFPNTLQHRVQPFELEDKTKPGHRKILVVFLVDPYNRVISTANVPPQRRDWWEELLNEDSGKRLNELPQELHDMIVDKLDFPIDMESAKSLRFELMEERKTYVKNQNRQLKENIFFLCEH